MSSLRRPSLLGALLWIGLGVLLLLYNFDIVTDFWSLAGRYWPILIILLGIGKILEYFLKKDSVAIRVGEIAGILILLIIGSAVTRISRIPVGRIMREMPIEIGGRRVSPGLWIGDSHTYSEDVTYPLEAKVPIRIENAYGLVSVSPGSDREIRVNLKKIVYGKEDLARAIAAEIHLQGEPEGAAGSTAPVTAEAEPGKKSTARVFVLRTNRDSVNSRNMLFNTDMEVLVPKDSNVQIVNSYGEVRAAEINGNLDITTSNKPLEVRDCTGQITVSTRYAACRLTNLKGNLNVDARGEVFIEGIKGDVAVKNEYSPLEIRDVDGTLSVTSTESSLKVERITKPVVINARGTQVEIDDLKDSLKLTASHRNADISNVEAKVAIESRYATLNLRNIKGDVEINSNADTIGADAVQGQFVLKARGSGVRANGVRGAMDIKTTLKDVVVNNFGDSCRISNEYAGISVASSRLGKDVSIRNRNGNVDVFLPEGASFLIDAIARNGRVESDYAGLVPTTNANIGLLKSKVKSGGPRITLETDYSNIHIYRAQDGEQAEANEADNASFPAATDDIAGQFPAGFRRSM